MTEDMGGRVSRFCDSAKHRFRHFRRDTRAGATSMAAAGVAAMVAGAAVLIGDGAWLEDQRDRMKASTDAGAIAAAVAMTEILRSDPTIDNARLTDELLPRAALYVAANMLDLPEEDHRTAIETLEVEVQSDRADLSASVKARANMGGTLLSRVIPLVRQDLLEVSAFAGSSSKAASPPLEMVFALDTSRSMMGDRLIAVKEAAQELIETLASRPGSIAFGLVPWSVRVKAPTSLMELWIREGWAQYPTSRRYPHTWLPNGGAETQDLPEQTEAWNGCMDHYRIVSGTARWPNRTQLFQHPSRRPFAFAIYPSGEGFSYRCLRPPYPTSLRHQLCYEDLPQIVRRISDNYPPYGAGGLMCSVSPMVPLSADADTLVNSIRGLGVSSNTNSTQGLLWAHRMLSYDWSDVWGSGRYPLDPDAPENALLHKVIVLLSDGDDGDFVERYDRDVACHAAKRDDVEIYVIAVNVLRDYTKRGLKYCSSETSYSDRRYYFEANNREEILNAFANIGLSILPTLRLTDGSP